MNKGVTVGSIILIFVMIIICAITIFVRKFSSNDIITDEMVEKSLYLDSLKRETEITDSLIKASREKKLERSKKSESKVTDKTHDHILPVIKDEKN